MLSEKILMQYGFFSLWLTPPLQGMVKDHTFPDFFFNPSLANSSIYPVCGKLGISRQEKLVQFIKFLTLFPAKFSSHFPIGPRYKLKKESPTKGKVCDVKANKKFPHLLGARWPVINR